MGRLLMVLSFATACAGPVVPKDTDLAVVPNDTDIVGDTDPARDTDVAETDVAETDPAHTGDTDRLDTDVLGETGDVGSSRVDLQACKLEYSIVSPK